MKIRFAMILATFASLSAAAPAQARDCLPREDVKKVLLFALPHLAEAARTSCGGRLPAGAFLNSTEHTAYVARLKSTGTDAGPSVVRFMNMLGGDLPEGVSAETALSLTRDMLVTKVASEIKPQSCAPIDSLLANFAKMPDEALADTLAIMLQLVDGSGKKRGEFNMCPAAVSQ